MESRPLGQAPTDPLEILSLEHSLRLPSFTSDVAYLLGTHIRARLRALFPHNPALISISLSTPSSLSTSSALTHPPQLLFVAASHPGTTPDNHVWAARKTATVARWGVSSWYMGRKLGGDEDSFRAKYALGEAAGGFAIHGGAVPIRVKGVEGAVGVVVVSGLKQDQDHMAAVEGLEWVRGELEREREGR